MDPVTAIGLAASAAQLGDYTISIARSILRYTSEVKEAPGWSAELRNELLIMSGILQNVKITSRQHRRRHTFFLEGHLRQYPGNVGRDITQVGRIRTTKTDERVE